VRTRAPAFRRAKAVIPDLFDADISVDLFAGGGGASIGTEAALDRPVTIAINHDPVAIAVHQDNHPSTEHYTADIFEVDPVRACRGRRVRHLHASPDCRHHSRAKGGKPVSESVRSLADVVVVWAEKVRPDVITLENVPEFIDWGPLSSDGHPLRSKRGAEFARWKGELEALGYVVEHRVLHAHHFGAPTSRKRLFLVARCDGEAIRWPAPTHGPSLKPFRTAAECIDFSRPCPSIFERKRPLADATLRRVAAGFVRFVLNNAHPYVVTIDNGSSTGTPRPIDEPLSTVIASNQRHAVVAPTLVQTGQGEREGQAPRVLDLGKPLTTVVGCGQRHGLVQQLLAPFVAKHYGGVVGHGVRRPLGTVTATDHHSVVSVQLAPESFAQQYPNARKVLPFLIAYYGEELDLGQPVDEPLRTITTRDRFALVTIEIDGTTYAVVDIGLRMLDPDELLRAQFGEFAKTYRLDKALTKKDQVRLVGNSVVPHMQRAVVAANLVPLPKPRATPRRRAA
jgi:DNA (cytosine-5)-methyltransferase 1